jgi:hypothetical protein
VLSFHSSCFRFTLSAFVLLVVLSFLSPFFRFTFSAFVSLFELSFHSFGWTIGLKPIVFWPSFHSSCFLVHSCSEKLLPHCATNLYKKGPIQGGNIQRTFREHSGHVREHSAQVREHSAQVREHSGRSFLLRNSNLSPVFQL